MSGPPPARPAGGSRASWYVGILALIILAYILLNTLRTEGPGSLGPAPGTRIPPFAAPAVLSGLEGNANVATPANTNKRVGSRPACTLRGADIVNSCQLGHDHPLVIGFFFTRGSHCEGTFDAMQRLAARHRAVRFVGVYVGGDRDDARKVVREHGWTFPIGFDEDGRVSTLYGIAVCPEVVLAYPGGEVRGTLVGKDADVAGAVERLLAASRARGWRPPS